MRPHDIQLLATPGSPAIHGDVLLVDVANPDPSSNSYRGGLVRVPPAGGTVRPFTHAHHDSTPAISPDGGLVAFLRSVDADAKPQLYVMPVDGGDARALTDLPLGAGTPVWSPDSSRIAFVAAVPPPGRYGVAGEDGTEAPARPAEAPRRVTALNFRSEEGAVIADCPAQLHVVDVTAEQPTPVVLTSGCGQVSDPVWTPDGSHVVVVASRDWQIGDTIWTDLYAVPAQGGDPVLVVRTTGTAALPAVTPDGELVYLGEDYTDGTLVACNTGVWAARLSLDGSPAQPRLLTDQESVDCEPRAGRPLVHGDGVLVGVRNRAAVELRRVPLGADRAPLSGLRMIAGEQAVVRSFAVSGERIVAVVSTWDSAGEVVLVEPDETVRLTDFSAPLRAVGIRPMVEIKAEAPDGYATHGFLVLPEGEGPHPVLLNVHGGPYMYFGWNLLDEAQVYASAGYAVVLPNPRGSAGYGQAHGRAIVGAMGTVDVADVLSVLDAALERPDLDSSRVGVMGGSYGGWMTGWLAAHHGDRFVAAWSERAVNSWDSFIGTSDIGWWFADAYVGTDPKVHAWTSPLTHVGNIRIPFAVVHSENDWRCPIEQALRMFVALRRNGVPTEMLIFPGEGHELTRSGQPRHREQRFEAVLDWWSRHL